MSNSKQLRYIRAPKPIKVKLEALI
jgi:hypothetical protein